MNVTLYNVSDPPNKINKSLGTGQIIENVRFFENDTLNVITPTIIFNLTKTESGQVVPADIDDYSKYNYLYIPKYARYYFIKEMTTENGLVKIRCKSDALYSFRKNIYGTEQYLTRSEKYRNRYIVDNLLPIHSQNSYDIHPFGEDVFIRNCQSVILETIGKGGTPS